VGRLLLHKALFRRRLTALFLSWLVRPRKSCNQFIASSINQSRLPFQDILFGPSSFKDIPIGSRGACLLPSRRRGSSSCCLAAPKRLFESRREIMPDGTTHKQFRRWMGLSPLWSDVLGNPTFDKISCFSMFVSKVIDFPAFLLRFCSWSA
jgi:hypothetical protein